ncbi:MAG: EamA family transporter [bacterium]|nr:EamA family transporter [bacterium]
MDWFFISLISPALWAVVCLIDDNLIREAYPGAVFGAVVSGVMSLLPVVSIFFVRIDTVQHIIALFGMVAGLMFSFSYLFYFKALQKESPSVTLALWNLAAAFLPLFAFIFLGEVLSGSQYFGVFLIVGASVLLSLLNVKKFKFSKAFYLMITASFLTAAASLCLKHAYNHMDFWSVYIYYSIGMGLGGFILMIFTQQGSMVVAELRGRLRKWIWIFIIAELINVAAVLVSNYAVSKGPVAAVKVIEGILPLYILTFAWLFHFFFPKYFPEGKTQGKLKKYFLMSVMVAGLYFIHI